MRCCLELQAMSCLLHPLDERYATLPVLFLTTQGHLEARIESARAGGDDHLVLQPPALAFRRFFTHRMSRF